MQSLLTLIDALLAVAHLIGVAIASRGITTVLINAPIRLIHAPRIRRGTIYSVILLLVVRAVRHELKNVRGWVSFAGSLFPHQHRATHQLKYIH